MRLGAYAGKPVCPDLPPPDVCLHFGISALICGVRDVGWRTVFPTPRLGPRRRFAFVLANAPLEPDPL